MYDIGEYRISGRAEALSISRPMVYRPQTKGSSAMTTVYFATHPEVVIDPAIPVPDWPLSEIGRFRIEALCARSELDRVTDVYTSSERKAVDCAEAFQAKRRVSLKIQYQAR